MSITVGELKAILENVPDEYEIIMEILARYPADSSINIAIVNTVKKSDLFREVRLKN